MFNKKQFLIDFFDYTKNYNLDGYAELKAQMQKDMHSKSIKACAGCRRGIVIGKYTRILLEKYSDYLSE
jgi:hypothetical protein